MIHPVPPLAMPNRPSSPQCSPRPPATGLTPTETPKGQTKAGRRSLGANSAVSDTPSETTLQQERDQMYAAWKGAGGVSSVSGTPRETPRGLKGVPTPSRDRHSLGGQSTQSHKEEVQKAVDQTASQVGELMANIQNIQSMMPFLMEAEKWKKDGPVLREKLTSTEAEAQERARELWNIRADLQTKSAELSQERDLNQQQKQQIGAARDRESELQRQVEDLERRAEELSGWQVEAESIQQEHAKEQKRAETLLNELAEQRKEQERIEHVQQELAETEQELEEEKHRTMDAEKEVAMLQQKAFEMQKDLSQEQTKTESMEQILAELHEKAEMTQNELLEEQQKTEMVGKELISLQQKAETTQQELLHKHQRTLDMEQDLYELREKAQAMQQELAQEKEIVEHAKRHLEEADEKRIDAETNHSAALERAKDLQDKVNRLEEDLIRERDEAAQVACGMEQDLHELREKAQSLQQELAAEKETMEKAKMHVEEADKKRMEAESNYNAAAEMAKDLQDKVNRLEEDLIRQRDEAAQDKESQHESILSDLAAEKDLLRVQKERLEEELLLRTSQLSDMSESEAKLKADTAKLDQQLKEQRLRHQTEVQEQASSHSAQIEEQRLRHQTEVHEQRRSHGEQIEAAEKQSQHHVAAIEEMQQAAAKATSDLDSMKEAKEDLHKRLQMQIQIETDAKIAADSKASHLLEQVGRLELDLSEQKELTDAANKEKASIEAKVSMLEAKSAFLPLAQAEVTNATAEITGLRSRLAEQQQLLEETQQDSQTRLAAAERSSASKLAELQERLNERIATAERITKSEEKMTIEAQRASSAEKAAVVASRKAEVRVAELEELLTQANHHAEEAKDHERILAQRARESIEAKVAAEYEITRQARELQARILELERALEEQNGANQIRMLRSSAAELGRNSAAEKQVALLEQQLADQKRQTLLAQQSASASVGSNSDHVQKLAKEYEEAAAIARDQSERDLKAAYDRVSELELRVAEVQETRVLKNANSSSPDRYAALEARERALEAKEASLARVEEMDRLLRQHIEASNEVRSKAEDDHAAHKDNLRSQITELESRLKHHEQAAESHRAEKEAVLAKVSEMEKSAGEKEEIRRVSEMEKAASPTKVTSDLERPSRTSANLDRIKQLTDHSRRLAEDTPNLLSDSKRPVSIPVTPSPPATPAEESPRPAAPRLISSKSALSLNPRNWGAQTTPPATSPATPLEKPGGYPQSLAAPAREVSQSPRTATPPQSQPASASLPSAPMSAPLRVQHTGDQARKVPWMPPRSAGQLSSGGHSQPSLSHPSSLPSAHHSTPSLMPRVPPSAAKLGGSQPANGMGSASTSTGLRLSGKAAMPPAWASTSARQAS